MGGLLHQARVD